MYSYSGNGSEFTRIIAMSGFFRLFRFAGVDVFVHWSWFRARVSSSSRTSDVFPTLVAWDGRRYVAGFALVTLHEFARVRLPQRGRSGVVFLWAAGRPRLVRRRRCRGRACGRGGAVPLVNLCSRVRPPGPPRSSSVTRVRACRAATSTICCLAMCSASPRDV